MRLHLAALIALAATTSAAQKCKLVKDEVDPFTKEREVVFKTRPIVGAWFVAHSDRLHLEWELHTTSVESIVDEAPITLLFHDGSTLPLTVTGSDVSDYVAELNWRLDAVTSITAEQLGTIAANPVKMIRWELTSFDYDKDYNSKMAEELQHAAQCLQQALAR